MGKKKAEFLKTRTYTTTLVNYVFDALSDYSERTDIPKARLIHNAIVQYLQLEKPSNDTQEQAN